MMMLCLCFEKIPIHFTHYSSLGIRFDQHLDALLTIGSHIKGSRNLFQWIFMGYHGFLQGCGNGRIFVQNLQSLLKIPTP
mmetsp:Transcript_2523/g.3719  ORF Transcript_2523/g.3719 Transcript_2523/m.3719 type:complete len:80 (+) Transcript_2523:74-313(+)